MAEKALQLHYYIH